MRVGFVGLGAMGLPMARRLAALPEVELRCFDLSPDRLAAAPEAARRVGSVVEAADGADALLTVLPADPHVTAVAREAAAAAVPPAVVMDFSTVHPATIAQVAQRLAARGTTTVSVSLARGTEAARDGTLVLYVGADRTVPEPVRRLLDALSRQVRPVGGLRAAKAVKLANNMVLGAMVTAVAEGLVLGHRLGFAAAGMAERLAAGGADSWALRHHVRGQMLTGDLPTGRFGTRYMAKDIHLFRDWAVGRSTGAALAGATAIGYRGTSALGYAEHYHPVVIRWCEHAAGLPAGAVTEDGPPGGRGAAGEVATVVDGVAAVATMASFEALAALRAEGVPPAEGVSELALGSAHNDGLAPAAQLLEGGRVPATVVTDRLDALLSLADRLAVPAVMAEAARLAADQLACRAAAG